MKLKAGIFLVAGIFALVPCLTAAWVPLQSSASNPTDVEFEVIHSELTGTNLRIQVPGFETDTRMGDGEEFVSIQIPGAGDYLEAGNPLVPAIRKFIAIPYGADYDISVQVLEEMVLEDYNLWPTQPQYNRDDIIKPPFQLNKDMYFSSRIYPSSIAKITHETWIRDLRTVMLEITPVRYSPSTGELFIATSLEISLNTTGGSEFCPLDVSPSFYHVYEQYVANIAFLDIDTRGGPEPMLIIADDALVPDLDAFIEWKTKRGVAVTLAPTSETGATSAEVRSYIETAYSTWNPKPVYVLLVGDYQQIQPMYSSSYGTYSDYLFTNLEGDDLAPDVFISRLSAQNSDQLTPQLSKIMHYETTPDDGAWLNHETGISSSQNGPMGIDDDERCDEIGARWQDHNPDCQVDQFYVSNGQGTTANIASAVNEGRFFIIYCGHGSGTSWSGPSFSNSDVDQLTNGFLDPFIMDVSCLNGGFGSSGDCFAERWMKGGTAGDPHGAVAMFSSYTSCSWDPPAIMAWGVTYSVTGNGGSMPGGNYIMGVMTCEGLMYMESEIGSGSDAEEICHQYVLFGDCSAFIRTDSLVTPTVDHLPTVPVAPYAFEVMVTDGRGPIENAVVSAFKPGDVHEVEHTDASGMAVLNLSPSSVGDLIITVTGLNLDPYEAIVTVAPAGCGLITLDSDGYNCDDLITIQVIDSDLNVNPNIQETVVIDISSDSEPIPEDVLLTETGPDTSMFAGTILTSSSQGDDGYLLVNHNDNISAHYHDEYCEGGVSDEYDSGIADCLGPAISLVTISNIGVDMATITWNTDESSDTQVTWGDTIPPGTVVNDPDMTTSHEVVLTGLVPCTTYYFKVGSTDLYGNNSEDDNSGNYYLFTTWELSVYFLDDVESGEGGWIGTGLWHIVDESSGCNEHVSPTHSWYYGQEPQCDFDVGTTSGTLTSDLIDLTDTSQADYHVWYWFEGESSSSYDYLDIQIQVLGGETVDLFQVADTTNGWEELVVDLAPYVGNQVYLKFYFNSVDGISNTYRGAYIDDVGIIAAEPCTGNCINDGDVNDTGTITAEDAQLSFGIALGVITPTEEEECAADCNGDGYVTAADSQGIFAAAMGQGSCMDPL